MRAACAVIRAAGGSRKPRSEDEAVNDALDKVCTARDVTMDDDVYRTNEKTAG